MEVLRISAIACFLAAAMASPALGQSSFHEGFEGPEPSLKPAGSDIPYRVAAHVRSKQSPHSGSFCEVLKVDGDNGQAIYFALPIGRGLIIAELSPSVWIRCDRPGLQVLARVVLPRSRNPTTGQPLTTLIAGTGYTQTGSWQQLRIEGIDKLFERYLRALRAQHGRNLDAGGAYVDQLVLNVYGGPGTTTVAVDDVDVAGLVDPQSISAGASANHKMPHDRAERLPAAWAGGPRAEAMQRPISLHGEVLTVDGAPMFPRIIEHRGESLQFLHSLGFNIALLPEAATPELLREAGETGMWLIAQPPSADELQRQPGASVGSQYGRVLAWYTGGPLTSRDLPAVKSWARLLKSADPLNRPILGAPQSDLRAFGHCLDVVLAQRPVIASSLELWDYFQWLQQRPRLARLGTPMWAGVATQACDSCRQQVTALAARDARQYDASYGQLRSQAFLALGAAARGLLFSSDSGLDSRDRASQARATALGLINLELQLVEPWILGSGNASTIESSDPNLIAVMLSTSRGRLLVPLPKAAGQQVAFGGWPTGPVSFTVPGASAASDAYEVTPAGMRPLALKRVTGGMRLVLDGNRDTMLLLTPDRLAVTNLAKRIANIAHQAVTLKRAIAMHEVEALDRRTTADSNPAAGGNNDPLAAVRHSLEQVDTSTTKADSAAAWRRLTGAIESINNLQHARWLQQSPDTIELTSNPIRFGPPILRGPVRLANSSSSEQQTGKPIAAGDFESLDAMLSQGWRHFQQRQTGVSAKVELSTAHPHSGRYSLQLTALPADDRTGEMAVEAPPLWIMSPPIAIATGQQFTIRGWVRTNSAITGSVDGLLIFDSTGGEPLAVRVRETTGWQPFSLVRVATKPGPVTVAFALSGFGSVCVDDVTVDSIGTTSQAEHAALPMRWPYPTSRR